MHGVMNGQMGSQGHPTSQGQQRWKALDIPAPRSGPRPLDRTADTHLHLELRGRGSRGRRRALVSTQCEGRGGSATAGLGWRGTRAAPGIGGKARACLRRLVHAGLHQLPRGGQGGVGREASRGPRGARSMDSRL